MNLRFAHLKPTHIHSGIVERFGCVDLLQAKHLAIKANGASHVADGDRRVMNAGTVHVLNYFPFVGEMQSAMPSCFLSKRSKISKWEVMMSGTMNNGSRLSGKRRSSAMDA